VLTEETSEAALSIVLEDGILLQSIISWISITLIPTEYRLRTLLSSSISWELTKTISRELCLDSQCTTIPISTTLRIETSG